MSFGGGFGSPGFGSNNNQQSGSLFGSGGGFGSNNTNNNSGFGSSTNPGFGASNASGGLFSGNSTSNTGFGSGSGGFGSNNNSNNNNNASSLFGGNRPAFGGTNTSSSGTGGGLFGSTSNNSGSGFGSTGFGSNTANNTGFGSNTSGGSGIFGNSNANNTSGFGASNNAGGSLFGSGGGGGGGSTSGFGSNAGGFASGGFGANNQNQNPGTGGITSFQPFSEKDAASGTSNYQSVTFQQPYSAWSFEELRSQDYDQGRKYGNQNGQGGAFGQSTGFGGTSSTNNAFNTSGGFGSGGGFGNQTNNSNNASGFGGQQSSGFGSSNTGGLFGQQNNKPAPLFGNNATSGQSSGGLFGTSNNTNTGGGLFGSSNTGGGFGSANKPAFGSNTTGGFGSNTNTGFGNNSSTGSAFGGGFGQNQQSNQAQSNPFGGFGNNQNNTNTAAKPLFGSGSGTSLFGNNQQNNQQPNQNPFGGASNQPNPSGGLFGNKPAGSSLFGNTGNTSTTGNSLFGNANTQNQQQNSGGLFGQQQPKPSLFGNNTAANTGFGSSTFGSSLNQTNPNMSNATGSLFGNTAQAPPQLGNSLFGGSLQSQQPAQPPQAQPFAASTTDQFPYGNPQLFANLDTPQNRSVGPIATPLSTSQKARRPTPLPQWKVNPYASTRLITPTKRPNGYGFSYSTYGTPGSAYGSSSLSNSVIGGGFGAHSLNKSVSVGNMRSSFSPEESLLSPSAFSPSLRASTGRGSMKRLHIDRSLRTDFFGDGDTPRGSQLKKTVSFDRDPALEANGETSTALVRRQDADATPEENGGYLRTSTGRAITNGEHVEPEMAQVNGSTPERSATTVSASQQTPAPPEGFTQRVEEARAKHDDQPVGGYWLSPPLQELKSMSREQLRAVEGFTVGRHGVAKIVFDKVNLQGVNLDDICGKTVVLNIRQATVYPDHASKPPEGKELNVPATCCVENSWPRAHQGRAKVMETSGPRFEKHLERLRQVVGTDFVSYDVATGVWTFRVQHFSTYQLDYEDHLSSSRLSTVPGSMGPAPTEMEEDTSMVSNGSMTHGSHVDDTFEFRKSRKSIPGGFDPDSFDAAFASGLEDAQTMDDVDEAPFQTSETRPSAAPVVDVNSEASFEGPVGGFDGQDDDPPRHSPTHAASIQPRSILKVPQRTRPTYDSPSKNLIDVEEDTWAGQLQRTLSPKKRDRQLLRESQGMLLQNRHAGLLSPMKAATGVDKPFSTSFDIMNSLFGKSSASSAAPRGKKQVASEKGLKWPYPKRPRTSEDDGMSEVEHAFHASFKPSFARNGTLITSGSRRNVKPPMKLVRTLPSSQGNVQASTIFPPPIHSQTFSHYRSLATASVDSHGIPNVKLSDSFSFSSFAASLHDSTTSTAEKAMWELLQILFDDQDSTLSAPIIATTRKTLLSQFWKSVVTPAALAQAERASNAEEKALAYLSANDVWSATEVLQAGGNPKLATMVSLLGATGEAGRNAVRSQLQHWRDNNSLSEIPQRIRALYEILAGNVCTAEGKTTAGPENRAENFCISARFGMDWKQAFGLRLWYGVARDEPLQSAVDAFDGDLRSYQEQVRPVPEKTGVGWTDHHADQRTDVLWSLLKLYAAVQKGTAVTPKDVADLIAPDDVAGNPLDAQLSFLVCQTLRARGLVDMSQPEAMDEDAEEQDPAYGADVITSTLLSQLSTKKEDVAYALFVALHLAHPASRQTAVHELLTLHAGSLGADPTSCPTWSSIDADLHIPASWVYQAKATHARAVLHDDQSHCLYLLRAGRIGDAVDSLRHVVAPDAVVAEELLPPRPSSRSSSDNAIPATGAVSTDLQRILAEFATHPDATAQPGWTRGLGGLTYSHFVTLTERVERKKRSGLTHYTSAETSELERLTRDIRSALPTDGSRDDDEMTLPERAAAWEMGRVVAEVEATLRAAGDDVRGFRLDAGPRGAAGNLMEGVTEGLDQWREVVGFA